MTDNVGLAQQALLVLVLGLEEPQERLTSGGEAALWGSQWQVISSEAEELL